ncbi:MAG: cytochrome c-type biogenesis protein CcmH [Achromobacter sp.]|nr:cytochrome c-type biogenesis protein CcmH [Achromobacter sp.]
MTRALLLLLLALHAAAPALAGEAAVPLAPALAERADRLAHGLRCLVCQNQSLAESSAPLAEDMRALIRKQLAEGRSDREVMRFFEDRYGDFVRYDPPFKPATWLLWLGPFALLAAGAAVLWRAIRRRQGPRAPLTEQERARVARFLDTEP